MTSNSRISEERKSDLTRISKKFYMIEVGGSLIIWVIALVLILGSDLADAQKYVWLACSLIIYLGCRKIALKLGDIVTQLEYLRWEFDEREENRKK